MVIVDYFFVHRLRQTLRYTTVHLAIDNERVDDVAAVIHSEEPFEFDLARSSVDLHDTNVGAEGEGGIARLETTRGLQAGFEIRWHPTHGRPVKVRGRKGHFSQGLPTTGVSSHIDFAVNVRHIIWPHIEHVCCDLLGLVLDLVD